MKTNGLLFLYLKKQANMKKLLILAFLFWGINCFSQNTYYDTKKLVKWYKLRDSSADKRSAAADVLGKILKYSEGGASQPFKQRTNLFINKIYFKADSIYSFEARYKIPKSEVVKIVIKSNRLLPPNLRLLKEKYIRDSLRADSFLITAKQIR